MAKHEEALQFYKENQRELVAKYNGKTLILDGAIILEVADDLAAAYQMALEKYGEGNFSLQEVAPGEDSYTSHIANPNLLVI